MALARMIGALLLAAAAIAVFFGLAPEGPPATFTSGGSWGGVINSVLSDDSLNQTSASSAPQQTVVNGWATRDLLEVIARQGADRDQRPAALLALGVLGVALIAFTTGPATKDFDDRESEDDVEPSDSRHTAEAVGMSLPGSLEPGPATPQ